MESIIAKLSDLYDRIPRRHTSDNVKEMSALLDEYEDMLQSVEGQSTELEKEIPPFFDALDPVRALIKKSNDNKASKKMKDDLFDEGSGLLKDSIQDLIALCKNHSE